jgi:hypothetical protein
MIDAIAVANAAVPCGLQINRRDLRFRRKSVGLWFTENQKECVNSAHGCFARIVKLRVAVTSFL